MQIIPVKVWLELLLNSERENMTELLEYKGYKAEYFWDDESNILFGNVSNIRDVITFQGYTEEDFKQAFRDSIDDYLNFCKERGEEPEKPNPCIGSNFDDYLKEEGIFEEVEQAAKRNIGMEILEGIQAIKDFKNSGSQLNHNNK
jgi:predicted RNase H-like HicB family nuclease